MKFPLDGNHKVKPYLDLKKRERISLYLWDQFLAVFQYFKLKP